MLFCAIDNSELLSMVLNQIGPLLYQVCHRAIVIHFAHK